jgi:hypothetical protein
VVEAVDLVEPEGTDLVEAVEAADPVDGGGGREPSYAPGPSGRT